MEVSRMHVLSPKYLQVEMGRLQVNHVLNVLCFNQYVLEVRGDGSFCLLLIKAEGRGQQ
jgi:hypothetical protein